MELPPPTDVSIINLESVSAAVETVVSNNVPPQAAADKSVKSQASRHSKSSKTRSNKSSKSVVSHKSAQSLKSTQSKTSSSHKSIKSKNSKASGSHKSKSSKASHKSAQSKATSHKSAQSKHSVKSASRDDASSHRGIHYHNNTEDRDALTQLVEKMTVKNDNTNDNTKEDRDVLTELVEKMTIKTTVSNTCSTGTNGQDLLTYEKDGLSVKQLPWTQAETTQVLRQLRFLKEELGGRGGFLHDHKALWKAGFDDLEERLKAAMIGGTSSGASASSSVGPSSFSRQDPMLQRLVSTMRGMNLVDMDKLSGLMETNQKAGDCIEGRDVLLLCGETGSGKTTTLQFLVGTSFEEVEVDGFLHFGPTSYIDPRHASFKTSYTREPTTRNIQAARVRINGDEEIAVCDIPSYDVATCLEEDIALGIGMVEAIRRARSVTPVVVLNRDAMGNRFSNLQESMRIVMRLCNITEKEHWRPFHYVFTKYDEKHRTLLHKQFVALKRNPPNIAQGPLQKLFEAFIEDIADKTDPEATVILPLDGHPANVLSLLTSNDEADKPSPAQFCANFASDFSVKSLQLQMQLQLHDFHGYLLEEDYGSAVSRIQKIKDLANMFPDMQSYVYQAKEAFLQQVAQIWVLVVRSIGKQDYNTALYRMEQLRSMAKDFPDAVECSELGREMLSQSINEPITNKEYGKSIQRMKVLSKAQGRFPEASESVELGLGALREMLVTVVKEEDFDTAIDLITQLGRAEPDIPEAFSVAQHGLHLVRESLMSLIEEEKYEKGMQLTIRVSELGRDLAEASGCVRRVLKIMRKRIEQSVQFGDYAKTGSLLQSLSEVGPKLYDGAEYVEYAFDTTAQHVCELRMEVINAFETLLKVKDQKKYTQLLEYASNAISNLLKSEPMRFICASYYNALGSLPRFDDGYKPNYLVILCTPKDCTSEAFCEAQVRHLVECISGELSTFETENTSIEYMMTNRKVLLSILLRLRAANRLFRDGPGGSMAAALYAKAFSRFEALIDGILSLSEASFDSSMEMKEFEFQAWFLSFLIQGFAKDNNGDEEICGDLQTMDKLDHRRVTLMLRFENEISETMELLTNYTFPDFKREDGSPPDFVAYFQEIKLSDLEAPRQLLLSLGQAPQLCKMMATMLSAKDSQKAVACLDKSVVGLFRRIVEHMEESYRRLVHDIKAQRIKYPTALRDGKVMSQTLEVTIRPEFTMIQNWSECMAGLEPAFARLTVLQETLGMLITKLQDKLRRETHPAGVFLSLIGSCSCLGSNNEEEAFLATLPVLSNSNETGITAGNPSTKDADVPPIPIAAMDSSEEQSNEGTDPSHTNTSPGEAETGTDPPPSGAPPGDEEAGDDHVFVIDEHVLTQQPSASQGIPIDC